jgi:hypothetical protein
MSWAIEFDGKRSMIWFMVATALVALGILGRLLLSVFRVAWRIEDRPKRRSKRDVYTIAAPEQDGEINIPPRRRED